MQLFTRQHGGVKEVHGDRGTGRFAQPEFHIHIRSQPQLVQHGEMRRFGGLVRRHQIVRREGRQGLCDESGGGGIKAVDDDESVARRRAENNAGNTADFKAADFS